MTNTWDSANRLLETQRVDSTVEPIYNGANDRVGQVVDGVQTDFALDIAGGLPEVIYSSEGNSYLHLPGVIVSESNAGETRYLLSDDLGSVRQALDESGAVVAYNEFDPYGNSVQNDSSPYGYTGEWWQDEVELLHLRARWYMPETGTFLSVDPVESEPPYLYVRGNPVNLIDPSGMQCPSCPPEPGATSTPTPDSTPIPEPVEYTPVPAPAPEPIAVGTPTPDLPQSPEPSQFMPPGMSESAQAIFESHVHDEVDGMIYGLGASLNLPAGLRGSLAEWGIYSAADFNLNGDCLPRSGGAGGFELVYDFKHQERGIFWYSGPNLNIGSIANVGGVAYVGTARGFSRQNSTADPGGYTAGVNAYSGYFGAGAASVSTPGLEFGGSVIEAAPLDEFQNLNSDGVFATYFGLNAGPGASLPVNVDIAVTDYALVPGDFYPGRIRYGLATWEELLLKREQKIPRQQQLSRRIEAAMVMTAELGIFASPNIGIPVMWDYHIHALSQLWSFVDRP